MKTLQMAAALLAAGVLISIAPLGAQEHGKTGPILLAMAANAKRVVQYEWKQRVTVIRKGNPSEPVIDQVRFDSSGKMQRTPISAPPKETGGIRGRIAGQVKENVKEIMELAASYNKPQQLVEAIRKAQVTQSPNAGAIRLEATDLIKPSDAMTLLVNSGTHLANHIDIKTNYDGAPMTVAQDYAPIPDGPNMMKSMRVSVPQKGLVINVDSYDFTQQTAREK